MQQMNSKSILIEKYIEPSEVTLNGDSVVECWFDRNYDLHSFMGQPAVITYINGKIRFRSWYKKGVRHRERNLPAYIDCNSNGQLSYQAWYTNGNKIRQI